MNRLLYLLVAGLCLALPVRGDDIVRIETRVDSARAAFGVTGAGTIVAILDRGIDYEHPDFRNPDGSTRLLYIFDMLDDSGAGDPDNPYGVGTIYTRTEIDSALASGIRLATRDAVGHGTATAGIAAGNGAASNGRFAGMAPGASLIAVKITSEGAPAHDGEPAEAPFYNPAYIPIGIDFVLDKAAEAAMPVVMLANFGSIGGPMDGTSSLSRAIETRFGTGFPGRVFISGSSDDGGMPNHAAGTVPSGQSIDLVVSKTSGFLRLDLWYGGDDRFDVEIITPTGTFGPYAAPAANGQRDTRTTGEFTYYHNGSDVDFYGALNGKREIMVDFTGPAGTYTLRLSGAVVNGGRFQASLNPSRIFAGGDNRFLTFAVPGHTIWDLAAAPSNITPNSYVLRPEWTDIDGFTRTFPGNDAGQGALWTGSGIGPTFDDRIGITVSAPGNSNIAAYGQRSYFNTLRFNRIAEGGGYYGILGAVSGAAPVLTGIVALMLEADSSLDAAMVADILQRTARSDAFTGATPNPAWGYGKVDAVAAVADVLGITGIAEPEARAAGQPATFVLEQNYPNPFNPETRVAFGVGSAGWVNLTVFDVLGRKVRTLVNGRVAAGRHAVRWNGRDDAGRPVAGGLYLYRLQTGERVLTRKMVLMK